MDSDKTTKPAAATAGYSSDESFKTPDNDETKIRESSGIPVNFPLFLLPEPMRKYIEDANRILNFPVAYMAMSMLAAVATAIGKTRVLHINTGFDCKPILYMSLIGPPGANKSHPLNAAFEPLIHLSNEMFQKSHEKCVSEESFVPETIVLRDYTLEAMFEIHEKNSKRICLFHDELATLFGLLNKYKSGSDEQLLIQLFEGKEFTSSRKTGQKRHVFIPETCPVIVSTSQPEIFNRLFKGKNVDNGLYYRFLQVRTAEHKKAYWHKEQFPIEHVRWWNDLLVEIKNKCDEEYAVFNTNTEYTFDKDAWYHISSWQKDWTDRLEEEGDSMKIGMFKKMQVYAAKFSLIIHTLLEFADKDRRPSTEIDFRTTLYAVALADYLLTCSFVGIDEMNQSYSTIENEAMDKLYNGLPECFKTMSAIEIGKNLRIPVRSVHRYLHALVDLGKIRRGGHGLYFKEM